MIVSNPGDYYGMAGTIEAKDRRIESLEEIIDRIQEAVYCAPLDDAMADIIMCILQENKDA
jgi:methionine synthase II (cobalamin-independent)